VDDFPPLGEGEIDFRTLVSALSRVGYRGPFSVELEVKNVAGPTEEDELRRKCYRFVEQLLAR
jgi:sugar phosphate isomerase/epimerase